MRQRRSAHGPATSGSLSATTRRCPGAPPPRPAPPAASHHVRCGGRLTPRTVRATCSPNTLLGSQDSDEPTQSPRPSPLRPGPRQPYHISRRNRNRAVFDDGKQPLLARNVIVNKPRLALN